MEKGMDRRKSFAGIPADEVIAFAEAINALDMAEAEMFGDAVNAAIVRNIKAAGLKDQQVSIRGLARVVGVQPATVRRRVSQLVSDGWLTNENGAIGYSPYAYERGAPAARRALVRFGETLRKLGWGDFAPPD